MRLASYNLHKCRGPAGRYDPARSLAVIAALDAEIVALQEVDFRLGDRPEALPRAAIETATGLVPVTMRTTTEKSLGWHGQTILLRPELARRARLRRLPLPGIEPRGALFVDLGDMAVVAVHLALSPRARRLQLGRLLRQLDRSGPAKDGLPLVVMGDFNEWQGDSGPLPQGFTLIRPGPSFPAIAPRLSLDRFVIRTTAQWRTGVADTDLARQASDHLPVWLELDMPS